MNDYVNNNDKEPQAPTVYLQYLFKFLIAVRSNYFSAFGAIYIV